MIRDCASGPICEAGVPSSTYPHAATATMGKVRTPTLWASFSRYQPTGKTRTYAMESLITSSRACGQSIANVIGVLYHQYGAREISFLDRSLSGFVAPPKPRRAIRKEPSAD